MTITESTFFTSPIHPLHRQYEALRAFFVEKQSAKKVAAQFDYQLSTVYSLTRDFKNQLKNKTMLPELFFHPATPGRKPSENHDKIREQIILLRKKYLSVSDIKAILDTQDGRLSERHIYSILQEEGFARLPRRTKKRKTKCSS